MTRPAKEPKRVKTNPDAETHSTSSPAEGRPPDAGLLAHHRPHRPEAATQDNRSTSRKAAKHATPKKPKPGPEAKNRARDYPTRHDGRLPDTNGRSTSRRLAQPAAGTQRRVGEPRDHEPALRAPAREGLRQQSPGRVRRMAGTIRGTRPPQAS